VVLRVANLPALIQTLFKGRAQLGNDHVIWEGYPYFDPSVPQRVRDIDKAKSLLAAAGVSNLTATLHAGELQEIPDLAPLLKSQAAEAGITLNVAVESLSTFYGAQWCPAEPKDPPCSGAAELGIVDYGHRATPDVYLNAPSRRRRLELVMIQLPLRCRLHRFSRRSASTPKAAC
jgi:peptide/nickel transport system substrate-binding protein